MRTAIDTNVLSALWSKEPLASDIAKTLGAPTTKPPSVFASPRVFAISEARGSLDQRAESTLVSIAVLIVPEVLRRAGSGCRHLAHAPRKRRAAHPHIF